MQTFSACSLAKSFQELYRKDCEEKKGKTDFTIVCDDFEIPVHSLVLSTRSHVLDTAMNGDFKENKEKKYRIKDFKPDSVKQMVKFLYGFEVTEDVEEPEELFRLGDMYDMEDLKKAAIMCMENKITKKNVFTIFQFAESHEYAETLSKCVDFVEENFNSENLSADGVLDKHPKLAVELMKRRYSPDSVVDTFRTMNISDIRLKYHSTFQDNLVFTVDSDICLTGIGIYAPENTAHVITAMIKVQKKEKKFYDNGEILEVHWNEWEWIDLRSISVDLENTSTIGKIMRVSLDPVGIMKQREEEKSDDYNNNLYNISLTMNGAGYSYVGLNRLREVSGNGLNATGQFVKTVKFNFDHQHQSFKSHGQIPRIYFKV